MRSKKGRGTTVKVSLPLRLLTSAPSTKSCASSLDLSTPPTSVEFFGFCTIGNDRTTEPTKAQANKWLLSSMERYCMQLGMHVYVAGDNLNGNASVHIISEQALKGLSQTNDRDLRRSLLSADSSRKPMIIIICSTRDSALRLRSGPLGLSLPEATQYLWLPIGPAKLAGALSACRKDDSDAAVLDATHASSQPAEEEHGPAHILSSTVVGLHVQDEDKGTASPMSPTGVPVSGEQLQVPQSPRLQRSGSVAADKTITSSLPLRAQINRVSTAPCVSVNVLSLLLVDDNVINSSNLVDQNSTDDSNRLSISAFLKSLLNGPDMFIARRRTVRRLWRSTKYRRNKSVRWTATTIQTSSWPSSQKSY